MDPAEPQPDALYRRIRAIGERARGKRGPADARYALRLKVSAQIAEVVGKALLLFVHGPYGWLGGFAALTYYFSVESHLNHSVMHGAFVGLPGAEKLDPTGYETFAVPFRSKTWGRVHAIHHQHPSLSDEDPDAGHPNTRVHRDQPVLRFQRLRLVLGFLFVFECWALDYDRFLKRTGRLSQGDRGELRKFLLFVGYHYVALTVVAALVGAAWPLVLLAAVLANVLRNIMFVVLQTACSVGHRVSTVHDRASCKKSRDEWVRFQVETSKNFRLRRWWQPFCGGLDRHIEHHLFPELPTTRLTEVRLEVQRVCHEHQVGYQEFPSVWASMDDSMSYLWRRATPELEHQLEP